MTHRSHREKANPPRPVVAIRRTQDSMAGEKGEKNGFG
jgi:hypothetical protein